MEKFKEDILSVDVSLNKKRASLWALGHIGSNENGIHLILEQELVPQTLFSVPRYDYKGNMSSDDKIMLAFQSLKRHVVLNNEE